MRILFLTVTALLCATLALAQSTRKSNIQAIDLGLSVKWANCNIGAEEPWECGGHYAWGETAEKSEYTPDNYRYNKNSAKGENSTLAPDNDAAHINWGEPWRMPTNEEIKELEEKCTWEWIMLNGCNGHKVTGPNGNSIFLPAAGYRDKEKIININTIGSFWASTVFGFDNNYSWCLDIDGVHPAFTGGGHECYTGRSVRAVCE